MTLFFVTAKGVIRTVVVADDFVDKKALTVLYGKQGEKLKEVVRDD